MDYAKDFQRLLREGEVYRTPKKRDPGLMYRMFGRFDWWLYSRILKVIIFGGKVARRGAYDDYYWAKTSRDIMRACEYCGCDLTIENVAYLDDFKGPCVYVSNHMSMAETFFLPVILLSHGPACFVLKKSLFKYAYFGDILKNINSIAVNRVNPREDLQTVLKEGVEKLKEGRSVIIFPQSTRSTEFNRSAFNTLGAKLASRAGVPLVPIALKTDFLANGKIIKDLGRVDRSKPVKIRIGRHIEVEGNGREAHSKSVEFIEGALREWGVSVTD